MKKDVKLENVYLYYGINDLSPGQVVLRNLDKRRNMENRPIYVFTMKPEEIHRTYKDIKSELSYLKEFYLNSKNDESITPEKLEEYKKTDKLILKDLFWYIKRLKKAIEKAKVNIYYNINFFFFIYYYILIGIFF